MSSVAGTMPTPRRRGIRSFGCRRAEARKSGRPEGRLILLGLADDALDADGGLAEEALRILEPLLGAAASLGGGEQEPEGELHQFAVVFPDGQVVQVVAQ